MAKNKISSTEKLDAVLRWLKNKKEVKFSFYESEFPIHGLELKKFYITEWEIGKILKKLVIDGYIDVDERGEPNMSGNIKHYSINFDGDVFIDIGGYTNEKKSDSIKTNLRISQTWAIVVGTIGLLIWEILRCYYICGCK